MKSLVLTLFVCCSGVAVAQTNEAMLLASVNFHDHAFDARSPSFMWVGKNPIVRYNPVSLLFGGALFGYQRWISPLLASKCPYELSCSAFSKASIQEFGLVKGVALSADRLTRCTEFTMIDMKPSRLNEGGQSIKDSPIKYRFHQH